tara:strand:- start:2607 stop:3887 length:1281 start_codon:yes stop_codon:yes gene_type:complete
MISLELNNKINFYLTSLLAFFVPIQSKLLPVLIILLILNWGINYPKIKLSFKNLVKNYALLSLIVLYLFYVIGMLNTENLKFGLRVLETKLSLLVIPLVYSAYIELTKQKIKQYLLLFVYGCLTYALICFCYATYAFFKPVYTDLYGVMYNLGFNYFYYNYLSINFHPSYSAMYSVFALLIITVGIKRKIVTLNWKIILSVTLLVVFILFLSSKAGWLTIFLLVCYVFVVLILFNKTRQVLYFIAPILVLFVILNIFLAPKYAQRIPNVEEVYDAFVGKDKDNKKVETGSSSSSARVFIWKASMELVSENLLKGLGTGDGKDKLIEKYQELGMTNEYKHELNSHNQYLTTSLSLGMIGLIILFFILFYPLIMSVRNKDILLCGFIFLLIINFMFESVIETRAGIIFFTFFYTLLYSNFEKINFRKQ